MSKPTTIQPINIQVELVIEPTADGITASATATQNERVIARRSLSFPWGNSPRTWQDLPRSRLGRWTTIANEARDALAEANPTPEPLAEVAAALEGALQAFESKRYELGLTKWDPGQPRVPAGKPGGGQFTSGSGGAGGGGESGVAERIAAEPVTPPPPGPAYKPDVEAKGKQGVTKAARVGVPADEVPPLPPMSTYKLPNLSPHEREIEGDFMQVYEADPDGVAKQFLADVHEMAAKETAKSRAKGKIGPDEVEPPTFGTDDAKNLHKAWSAEGLSDEERLTNRSTLNVALHQTANAIAKRAFLQHLDTLKPGDEVLVTVGGCGAGKGYALGEIPEAHEMKMRSKAVWDSAGDQNATENVWIQQELEKRGLKGNYLYVSADPEFNWTSPDRGVVQRASTPKDGRMVDAQVFADSYALGAKNHAAFAEANKSNPNANFIYLENNPDPRIRIRKLDGVPEAARNLDRHKLLKFAMQALETADAPPRVKRGGSIGARIWGMGG